MSRPFDGLSTFAGVSLSRGVSGPLTRIRFLLGGLAVDSRPPAIGAGEISTSATSGAGGLFLDGDDATETRTGDPITGGNDFSRDLKPVIGDCEAVAWASRL